jgi:hypothetical protein
MASRTPQFSASNSRRQCPGFRLDFGEGCLPPAQYPFQIHGKHVSWDFAYIKGRLFVRSHQCRETLKTNSDVCDACSQLRTDTILEGIMDRHRSGALENTPYQWLSYDNLSELLQRKNDQINDLKLRRLNLERSLLVRARHLTDFKRFLFAVSQDDIPRLHSLAATALRQGSSVSRILEKIDLAVRQVYHPKGYAETDFQRQFLFHKMGNRIVADLAHRTCGLPSMDTTQDHIRVQPILVSAKAPTLSEMKENLKISFPPLASTPVTALENRGPGFQLSVDEIKVEKRLQWDASRNLILGPCREDVKPYSVEFRTMEQPKAIVQGILDNKLHFAAEVRVSLLYLMLSLPIYKFRQP